MRSFIVLLALLTLALSSVGCSDLFFGRDVEGRVVAPPTSRYVTSDEGAGQEKFALKLNPYTSDAKVKEVAGGPNGLMIECVSTRCAQVAQGECHRFQCKYVYRWNQPDVIQCQHAKEIECLPVEG